MNFESFIFKIYKAINALKNYKGRDEDSLPVELYKRWSKKTDERFPSILKEVWMTIFSERFEYISHHSPFIWEEDKTECNYGGPILFQKIKRHQSFSLSIRKKIKLECKNYRGNKCYRYCRQNNRDHILELIQMGKRGKKYRQFAAFGNVKPRLDNLYALCLTLPRPWKI